MGLKNWGDEVEGVEETKPKETSSKGGNFIELIDGELPESETSIDNGVKTVVSFTRREDGKVEKKTRVFKIEERKVIVSKSIMKRRKWAKFGCSKNVGPGPDSASTNIITDDIYLELKSKKELKHDGEEDEASVKKLLEGKARLVMCRICKGEHWTTKCPYKDKLGIPTADDAEGADGAVKPTADAGGPPVDPTTGGVTGNRYVPPRQRLGRREGEGESMDKRDETATIRITNLSENTREEDLRELFRPFGSISRCYLATDRETGAARGFAFINYLRKDDAQAAIDTLNGHGYDHLILQVEWAEDRKPTERS
eukprot:m.114960 g.114960  ORF g.114960 m.114960 type:complete len:312 (+) comp28387_c0_seq1:140-1075(+)